MPNAKGFGSQLRDFADRVGRLEGSHDVSLPELFPPEFMLEHTDAANLQAFVDASPWSDLDNDGLSAVIGSPEWDQYVADHSSFTSWTQMRDAGVAGWARRKIAK